jgi:7-cyano-7-deazaguanine reductase
MKNTKAKIVTGADKSTKTSKSEKLAKTADAKFTKSEKLARTEITKSPKVKTTAAKGSSAVKTSNKGSAKDSSKPKKAFKTITPTAYTNPEEKLYGEKIIEENQLERFPNRTLVRTYSIEFTCPEFTCVCPRSGFPDFATIYIHYIPDQWCIELKSLKLYINGFRNEKVFHEDVTNQILDDLVNLLDPWEIEVIGDFSVRGNIKTVIRSKHVKNAASVRE